MSKVMYLLHIFNKCLLKSTSVIWRDFNNSWVFAKYPLVKLNAKIPPATSSFVLVVPTDLKNSISTFEKHSSKPTYTTYVVKFLAPSTVLFVWLSHLFLSFMGYIWTLHELPWVALNCKNHVEVICSIVVVSQTITRAYQTLQYHSKLYFFQALWTFNQHISFDRIMQNY